MDRARPGTWFTRGYFDDGVDKVQFDCCKEQMYCSLSTVRVFKHCPFCGCKLTNQRAIRPVSASMWKGVLPKTVTVSSNRRRAEKPFWSIEWKAVYGDVGSGNWREYCRVYPQIGATERQSALTQLRQAIASSEEDGPWCDEHFRLVYGTWDRVIGVIERPNWVVGKTVS